MSPKRLVLFGEGQGDEAALPVLVRRILEEKGHTSLLFVDDRVHRKGPCELVTWDKQRKMPDFEPWKKALKAVALRHEFGGVLAVYDGDLDHFPPGENFCVSRAAKLLISSGREVGAGEAFSLCVVFACVEYETWLVAGAESLAGKRLSDGRPALPANIKFPEGDRELQGKRWLEKHCQYRPSRDQSLFTQAVDLQEIRKKELKSFLRLERAIDQLAHAMELGCHVATP